MISEIIYKFDKEYLKNLYLKNIEFQKPFVELNDNVIENFYILKINDQYLNELLEKIGVDARPRFLMMKPGCKLPYHKDAGTQSAINILLEGHDPINIEGKNFYYNQALIDVQQRHTVNVTTHRLVFKFSFFDINYELLKQRLKEIQWII